MGTRLSARGRGLAIAGVAFAAAGPALGVIELTRLGILLVLLVAGALVLATRQRVPLRTDRRVHPLVPTAGESALVTVRVTNPAGRRSGELLVAESLPPVVGSAPRARIRPIVPGGHEDVAYEVHPRLRGRHALGPMTARVADPLGLTRRTASMDGVDHLLVLPRVVDLGRALPTGSGTGTLGELTRALALSGENDVSVREYRRGDDRRRIHWRSTARTSELMVRQEENPVERAALVVLDGAEDSYDPAVAADAFELAVVATASLLVRLAEAGYAVQLVADGTVHDGVVDRHHGAREGLAVLAETCLRPRALAPDLTRAIHSLGGGLLVAVTGTGPGAARIARLRTPGTTGLALVMDPDGSGGGVTRRGLVSAGWYATDAGPDLATAWTRLVQDLGAGASR